MWSLGSVIYLWVILGTNVTILRRSTVILPIMMIAVVGSVVCHPVAICTLEMLGVSELKGTFSWIYGQGGFRFGVSTILFLAGHIMVGEPIIRFMEKRWVVSIETSRSEYSDKRRFFRDISCDRADSKYYRRNAHSNQVHFEKHDMNQVAKGSPSNLGLDNVSDRTTNPETDPLL